jgi:hypothetical protein
MPPGIRSAFHPLSGHKAAGPMERSGRHKLLLPITETCIRLGDSIAAELMLV